MGCPKSPGCPMCPRVPKVHSAVEVPGELAAPFTHIVTLLSLQRC